LPPPRGGAAAPPKFASPPRPAMWRPNPPPLDREDGIRSTWQWFCEHVFRD